MAWPYDADEWGGAEQLATAQREWMALVRTLGARQRVEILTPTAAVERLTDALEGADVRLHTDLPYDDIWLRDTAPLLTSGGAACFKFNGWGERFPFEHDMALAPKIAAALEAPVIDCPWVMEGGAIDVDGEGTALTTTDCVLNPNRWPEGVPEDARAVVEDRLRRALGVRKVIWLTGCLPNDHTDGHVDTLARFVAPGHVVCMRPGGHGEDQLQQILDGLTGATDAAGRALQITLLPTPPAIEDDEGDWLAATYANFYIGNGVVTVPAYGVDTDEEAAEVLQRIFPDHTVRSLPSRGILAGGGSFHCITQQQPTRPIS